LVEGGRDQGFVRKYLVRRGIEKRAIRLVALPAGTQSGEQYVREKYAEQVGAFRWRSTKAITWLIVAIDADNKDVAFRARQLAQELIAHDLPPRNDNEAIVHLIPKRNIETWILCLTGEAVDEENDYSDDNRVSGRLPQASVILFDWSRRNATPSDWCVPSLHTAIPELRRLK
jgi:hypothetical protein